MAPIIILAVVVAFIVSTVLTKKLANKIYILTGYNGFSGLHRTLCASMLIILLAVSIIAPDNVKLGFLALVPVVVLALLNLKAKNPVYIVALTVLQFFYGIAWFFFFLLKLFIKFVFHADFNAFNVELKPLKDATIERANYCAKQKNYADANEWAQKEGLFADAATAYEAGFFTGKLY